MVLSRSGLFGIRTLKQWIGYAAAASKCSLKAKPLLEKPIFFHFHHHMKCVVSWSLNNDFSSSSSSISQEHKFSTYGFTDDVWHHSLNMRCKIWKPVACTHCLKSIKNVSFVAFDVNGFAKDLHGVCLRVGVGVKGVCTGCEPVRVSWVWGCPGISGEPGLV